MVNLYEAKAVGLWYLIAEFTDWNKACQAAEGLLKQSGTRGFRYRVETDEPKPQIRTFLP